MTERAESLRKWRWGRIVLVVSLAFNLLVIGALMGAVWRHGGEHGARGPGGGFAGPYVRALPREDRRAVWQALKSQRGQHPRGQGATQYAPVLEALRSDPFDPEAVRAALRDQLSHARGFRERAEAAWLDRIAAMDAAERQAYAARVEDQLTRRKKRRRWKSD